MGDQLEFIDTNVAKSVVNATSSCCKNMIVMTIIFFVILSAAKFFWLKKYCLPEFTFRQNPKSKGNKHENPYCTVCLYEVANGEKFRKLPECKHCFHVECIDAWFQSSSTCPLCRSEIALVLRRRNQQRSLLSLFLSILHNIVRIMDKFDLNSQSSFATGGTINL